MNKKIKTGDTAYIPSLDGIRFLAVSLVLFDHWSGDALGFPASYLGVCLFFVLSGFLITRILLHAKEQNGTISHILKAFYIRRTIRIFPLYYLVLVLLFVFGFPVVREHFVWLVSYTSNMFIALNKQWMGKIDHLWSLAVEEQYYLFFPITLLLISRNKTVWLFLGMVLIALGLRTYFYLTEPSWIPPYVLMPACLDAFGLGGLLAWLYYFQNERILKISSHPLLLVAGLLLYIGTVILLDGPQSHFVRTVLLRFSESLVSVLLISYLILGKKSFLHLFAENTVSIFIGKISYGIYIFHNLIYNPYHEKGDSLVSKLIQKVNDFTPNWADQGVKMIVLWSITILVASFSWFIFEKPINALKKKYGY